MTQADRWVDILLWTNPKTGVDFKVSNHGSQEVATGPLKNILKAAGIK